MVKEDSKFSHFITKCITIAMGVLTLLFLLLNLLKHDFSRDEWFLMKGILLYNKHKPEHALKCFEKTESPLALIYKGRIALDKKEYESVISIFTKYKGMDDWRIYYYLGVSYFWMKDFGNSINNLMRSLAISPQREVFLTLSLIYGSIGEHKNAIDTLKKALTIYPADKELLYVLAVEYMRISEIEKAKEVYEALEFLEPSLAKEWQPSFPQ